MVRFEIELRRRLAAGESWTEMEASDYLLGLRRAQEENLGASFETIAAYGPNAAMMHYAPTPQACAAIEPHGFLLVDSGGQYRDGTTDITRTYALGALTEEEREDYTLVLKCHIAAARAVFKEGSAGQNIDILARETLWRRGLDYRCGTGYGVGFVGGVHEGPQSLSARGTAPFVPGMTITDEPGIYEEGNLGIRIENELLCVPVCETEYGKFYGFEPFTYCPIDTRPLVLSLMEEARAALAERLPRHGEGRAGGFPHAGRKRLAGRGLRAGEKVNAPVAVLCCSQRWAQRMRPWAASWAWPRLFSTGLPPWARCAFPWQVYTAWPFRPCLAWPGRAAVRCRLTRRCPRALCWRRIWAAGPLRRRWQPPRSLPRMRGCWWPLPWAALSALCCPPRWRAAKP